MRDRSLLLAMAICISVLALSGDGDAAEPRRRPTTDANPPKTGGKTDSEANKKEEDEEEQPEDRYFAITGATVHTVTGPVLRGPTVLCKNGKIVAIGHGTTIPDGTEVLAADGFHVYPGLVAVRSGGLLGGEPPDDNTDLYGLSMTLGLAGGITTAVTGNTAAKLSFGTLDDHVVKRNLFHNLQYSTTNPAARRKLRQTLERARQYLRDLQTHAEKKKTHPKAKPPTALKGNDEKALKLLRQELVALSTANSARELTDLADLARRYGFRLVVQGALEGWVVAPDLARSGVEAMITPRVRRDRDERTNRRNGSSIENAKILHSHGVRLAIIPPGSGTSTMGLAGRDLMHLPMAAAFAVRGGLSDEAALQAITIDAARVLGIDHRVGSIEVGKDADFAIVDGDVLHYMTLVRWTVVNGRVAYDKQKDSLLNHIRPDGNRDAPPPPESWPRRLGEEW